MSDPKITELLAVLDITEEEQWKKLRSFTDGSGDDYERGLYSECLRKRVLADLAFRLRDEVFEHHAGMHGFYWTEGKKAISEHLKMNERWFNALAQPIHWIIAALIAKEIYNKR